MAGAIRQAEWGHWGITFLTRHDVRDYAPASIEGVLYFQVGHFGPMDVPKRDEYMKAIKAWQQSGVLPAGLDRRLAEVR